MIGKTLGHYEILGLLGKGGMGEVYRARDTRLGREVALKILPEEMARDGERLQRFEREAKAVAALNHPNIVTIHSVEQVDGRHFLTMELIEGQTLSQLLQAGGLPLDRFFQIAIPLADALSAAHAKGVTHRDLKPANVMVDAGGRLKVLDFGLAKLLAPAGDEGDATLMVDEQVTSEGKILGTVAYMSPEQAESRSLDHRSDIFSLGILLYEMVTGDRPFQGDTPLSTISSILKDTPTPVTQRKAVLPRHLGRVIGRCLEKNPEKRFQTARDVCNELEGLQKEIESGELEPFAQTIGGGRLAVGRSGRHSFWPWLGLAVVVVAAGAYLLFFRDGSTQAPRELTARPVTSLVGTEVPGSWSPDGGFIAYSHSASGPMDIFIVSSAGGDPMRLVESPYDDTIPRWSPDNRWIAFVSSRGPSSGIYLVPPLGGQAQLLVDTGLPPLSGSSMGALGTNPWSPDGKTLLFSRKDAEGHLAVWKVELDTREETRLTDPGAGRFDVIASYSFAGDRILFNRMTGTACELMTMPATGGEPRSACSLGTEYAVASWSPDGRSIVYSPSTGGLWQVNPNSGIPRRLTTGDSEDYPIVARDGRILYSIDSHQTDLYEQSLTGAEARRLTYHTKDNFGARLSSDGTRLVYSSTRTGDSEIWLMDLEKGTERQLTQRESQDWGPDWTPDGREIIFASDHGGEPGIWAVSAEGGALRELGRYPMAAGSPRVSPDGEHIGFIGMEEGGPGLLLIGRQGGAARQVLVGVTDFAWYRDSDTVIYTPSGGDTSEEIRIVDLESGAESLLLETPHLELAVAADGSALSYCSSLSHFNMNLHVVRLVPPIVATELPRTAGPPKAITHGDGQWHVHNGGWSSDGQRVVYTRDTDTGDLYVLEGVF